MTDTNEEDDLTNRVIELLHEDFDYAAIGDNAGLFARSCSTSLFSTSRWPCPIWVTRCGSDPSTLSVRRRGGTDICKATGHHTCTCASKLVYIVLRYTEGRGSWGPR